MEETWLDSFAKGFGLRVGRRRGVGHMAVVIMTGVVGGASNGTEATSAKVSLAHRKKKRKRRDHGNHPPGDILTPTCESENDCLERRPYCCPALLKTCQSTPCP